MINIIHFSAKQITRSLTDFIKRRLLKIMFNDFFETFAYESYINMLAFITRTSNKHFYIKFRIMLKMTNNILKRL